ncbi:hypothetical protein [Saccharopolyspora dendranthemae]|uniref:Uncharacterized protein n=1 Tax=Saccharopolyspora dendranthemae TaxID=1181886 RepID=A0A561U0R6_9PSEU|nr:hypothetical protein [Saccharopolyspora dendranthemae]TWF92953.1 hypothetical protein FHU35_16236 [Saccharopolyspora dendranthemae]
MRARVRIAAAVLSLPLLAGLAACGEIQEAQEGLQNANQQLQGAQQNLDSAQACLQAINAANFVPNFADPQKAQTDAQAKVTELQELANSTADQTLRQNLLDVQDSVQQVADGKVDIEASAEWTSAQLEKYQTVTTTCSRLAG